MKAAGTLVCIVLFLVACRTVRAEAACRDLPLAHRLIPPAYAADADASIQYFGHNFFQITTRQGTRIVTDPLAPGRYPTPRITPHVVTVGREHPNHNSVQVAQGDPLILRGLAQFGAEWNRVSTQAREVRIYNVPIYQNGVAGALKGAAFVFDLGSLCIVHLGDLGHPLTPELVQQIGHVDVALIPIDGIYTMGPDIAREVLQQLNPKLAIPMHYRDDLRRVEAFTRGLSAQRAHSDTLLVSKSLLPAATEIIVLRPQGARE
ncbi:MAG TPA: MBL fold metallo-hydrolase [Candidatus Tectomicrobia bacterium]|jgi:L-ascorbate metabolism protein UlaG (beta-lactamase superfamily)